MYMTACSSNLANPSWKQVQRVIKYDLSDKLSVHAGRAETSCFPGIFWSEANGRPPWTMCRMVEGTFLFHFLCVFLLEMWTDNSKRRYSVLIFWMCFHCCDVWVLPTEKEQEKKNLLYSAVIHFILISVSLYLLCPDFPPAPHPLRFSCFFPLFYSFLYLYFINPSSLSRKQLVRPLISR